MKKIINLKIISAIALFCSTQSLASQFNIPDGSAYICRNIKATDMLLQLRYSRTSPELATIIIHAPTNRIDNVLTWSYISKNKNNSEMTYDYRNTNVNTTMLTINQKNSTVIISGSDATLMFEGCLMVGSKTKNQK